jgi:hypothetical protein
MRERVNEIKQQNITPYGQWSNMCKNLNQNKSKFDQNLSTMENEHKTQVLKEIKKKCEFDYKIRKAPKPKVKPKIDNTELLREIKMKS